MRATSDSETAYRAVTVQRDSGQLRASSGCCSMIVIWTVALLKQPSLESISHDTNGPLLPRSLIAM